MHILNKCINTSNMYVRVCVCVYMMLYLLCTYISNIYFILEIESFTAIVSEACFAHSAKIDTGSLRHQNRNAFTEFACYV